MSSFQRKLVPMKEGEAPPRDLLVGEVNGMRLETDDEFRERIKREIDNSKSEDGQLPE